MARPLRWLLIGVSGLVLALLLIDWSVMTTGDGAVPITVIIESDKQFRLRKVAYDHYAKTETVEHAEGFRGARILDDRSFVFEIPTSERVSLFGITYNTFAWPSLAVFRLEGETGDPIIASVAVPDPRTTKALAIKFR